MNTQGIALAADSAVTVNTSENISKVYNTANKLFMLSKHAPVGIMIFGNSQLTNVPWETIVKAFRRELGTSRLDTVFDYSEALIKFIQTEVSLFPPTFQEQDILGHSISFCRLLISQIEKDIEAQIQSVGSIDETTIKKYIRLHITNTRTSLSKGGDLPEMNDQFLGTLRQHFRKSIDTGIDISFEKYPLTKYDKDRLRTLLVLALKKKDIFPYSSSGIVIAGFGEKEYFPSLRALELHGVWLKHVRMKITTEQTIGIDNLASIVPFAQREMISLFMEGIHPQYREILQKALETFMLGIPEAIKPSLKVSTPEFQRFDTHFKNKMQKIMEDFMKTLQQFSHESHVSPIISTVSILPKDELASMAEALVNLTSFKRRVTLDQETVGGPIDVAVISKGDGFVWIKRKHYFDASLNPQFFRTYEER